MNETYNESTIEAVVGTMYAGKTEYITERKKRAEKHSGVKVFIFKPDMDNRKDRSIKDGIKIKVAWDILKHVEANGIHKILVIIDDAHFLDKTLIYVIQMLKFSKANIVISGLDKDFRGQPFGYMPHVMALSDRDVNHLRKAVCYKENCDNDAVLPQRLRNGKPDSVFSKTVIVEGSTDSIEYFPACRNHHVIKDLAEYIYQQKKLNCDIN